MAIERIRQQLGIEAFLNAAAPDSETGVDGTSTVILATSAGRAFAQVELVSVFDPDNKVFISRGTTALIDKGMMLQLGVPQKFYGPLALFGIMTGTTPTCVIAFQEFGVLTGVAPPMT